MYGSYRQILANPASSSQIPNPVKIFCVFPNPAPYFGQIPDPENTLSDPVQNRQYSPKFAIYSYKDDKSQQLRSVYLYFEEKYQHFPPIFCFKYEARNIPIQILQISNRLSGSPVQQPRDFAP